MAMEIVIELVFLSFSLLIFLYFCIIMRKRNTSLLTNWPLVGMTPGLLKNAHKLHDFVTRLLQKNHHTFHFRGPFLAQMDILFTSNPDNITYILSKNFSNYPKGPEFRKIFDVLGDGILSSDGHGWEVHRKITMSLFNHVHFYQLLQSTVWDKVHKGLLPLLDHVSEHGLEVDFQDTFQRLTFDNICSLLLDHDPESLSIHLPYNPCHKAIPAAEEALFYRHILPESIWKLQSWIGVGKEKCLTKAREAVQQLIYPCITLKRKQLRNSQQQQQHLFAAGDDHQDNNKQLDFLASFIKFADKENTGNADKFLADTLLSLMLAGRDTTSATLSWFFWLLWKNPLVESKILEEIETNLPFKDQVNNNNSIILFDKKEELQKLVYLHGALCETLRLFPPVAFNHKAPTLPDILPSGHPVDKNTKIVLSFYSMGRMESLWGKDCLEFKPERWINEKGGTKNESSYKFTSFNAGARSCLGKEMTFTQMKIVATTIIHTYKVEVVKGQNIVPSDSVVLEMKHGLKVKLAKRNASSVQENSDQHQIKSDQTCAFPLETKV